MQYRVGTPRAGVRRLEAPAYPGGHEPEDIPRLRSSEELPIGAIDRFVSKVAIGVGVVGGLLAISALADGGAGRADYIVLGMIVGVGPMGALSLYLNTLWRQSSGHPWRRVLVLVLKPMCAVILFPLILVVLPLFLLWLFAWTKGWGWYPGDEP